MQQEQLEISQGKNVPRPDRNSVFKVPKISDNLLQEDHKIPKI